MISEKTNITTHALNVHSIESLGTYDGPGIRMVVFLQGCPFSCLYCANPDTMDCHGGSAMEQYEILERARHMKTYLSAGGGVTFSGGEPCLQAKQLIPMMKQLKEEGLHICLDTNGHVFNKYVEEMLQYVDLVLLDIKHIDRNKHQYITGRSHQNTLDFANYLEQHNRDMWLRYVLVPGLTDDPDDLNELGSHFEQYHHIKNVEIQPYHTLGAHKWKSMGMSYPLEATPQNTPEQLENAKHIFDKYFDQVVIN
ncbi:MAG: pyruvate formate lyase-activating protein [Cyclobacteriaceae bacterium]